MDSPKGENCLTVAELRVWDLLYPSLCATEVDMLQALGGKVKILDKFSQ